MHPSSVVGVVVVGEGGTATQLAGAMVVMFACTAPAVAVTEVEGKVVLVSAFGMLEAMAVDLTRRTA